MRSMTLATVLVAISGYLILIVASHALGKEGYEIFLIYWGFFFALTGFLDGLMQETTRAVTARQRQEESAASPDSTTSVNPGATAGHRTNSAGEYTRPVRAAAFIAAFFALLIAVTSPLYIEKMAPETPVIGATLLVIGLASYAFQALLCGLLSAALAWNRFALLITIDSVARLALALAAWALGWHTIAFLVVTILGAITWLGFALFSSASRALLSEQADADQRTFLQRTFKAMIASGANAVVITGFPVLLKFTTDSATAGGALAATITAVTITRAPILVPLQRFQPALIVHFTKAGKRVLSAALLPIAAVAGIAAIGGIAAFLIGRPLLGLFFKDELLVSPMWLGLFTLVSGATAILMITGSATLAAERHTLYSLGWVVATIVAIGALFLEAQPEVRAMVALGIGPVIGAIVHLAVLTISHRRAHPTMPRNMSATDQDSSFAPTTASATSGTEGLSNA